MRDLICRWEIHWVAVGYITEDGVDIQDKDGVKDEPAKRTSR
jgi:hypothetical protein